MTQKVFIDGETGTTGLLIREHLQSREEIQLVTVPDGSRRKLLARAEALNAADLSILCLPEAASREAVSLIENAETKVIDTSIAYRTDPQWVFGFPEYSLGQREKIQKARRVTNPGCYACGAIAILHPLIVSGIITEDYPVTVNAVSGYSGGGKKLISEFENKNAGDKSGTSFYHYALNLKHKHTEEMRVHSGLKNPPLFVPSVGRFARGMIVSVPLHLWLLPSGPKLTDVHYALSEYYSDQQFVVVEGLESSDEVADYLNPESLNATNRMKLYVFGNQAHKQVVVAALFDNLGKGASGQAVQCLNIMLGLEEGLSL